MSSPPNRRSLSRSLPSNTLPQEKELPKEIPSSTISSDMEPLFPNLSSSNRVDTVSPLPDSASSLPLLPTAIILKHQEIPTPFTPILTSQLLLLYPELSPTECTLLLELDDSLNRLPLRMSEAESGNMR